MAETDKTMVMPRAEIPEATGTPRAKLTCLDPSKIAGDAGAEIELHDTEVTVGRGDANTVALQAEGVSKVHARFRPAGGTWMVEDTGSTNGTRVNNSRIAEPTALSDGDNVSIGRAHYKFHLVAEETPTKAAPKLDIGEGEKTVIMRPGARKAAADAEAAAPKPSQRTSTGVSRPAEPRPPAASTPAARPASSGAKKGGRGALLWVIVVLGIVLIGGAAAMMLGVI